MSAEKTTEPDEVLTDDELQAAAAPEQSIEEDDKRGRRRIREPYGFGCHAGR